MENASKALLIAGSILIAILLIAIGVKVFNSSSGTADNAEMTMNATKIATFNNKFTAYIGNKKSAANVKALANAINANNATNTAHKVKLKVLTTEATDNAATITSNVSGLSGSYKIEIPSTGGYDENGYIVLIQISSST